MAWRLWDVHSQDPFSAYCNNVQANGGETKKRVHASGKGRLQEAALLSRTQAPVRVLKEFSPGDPTEQEASRAGVTAKELNNTFPTLLWVEQQKVGEVDPLCVPGDDPRRHRRVNAQLLPREQTGPNGELKAPL